MTPPTLRPRQDVNNMSFLISSTSWCNNSGNNVISTMLNQRIINEVVDVGAGPNSTTTLSQINLRLSSTTTYSTIHLRLSRSATWSCTCSNNFNHHVLVPHR